MEITINEKILTIKKLPLKKYVDLLKAVEDLPKHFDKIAGRPESEIIANIPFLLEHCAGDIYRIVNIATGADIKEVEETWGLDDLVSVFTAIFTVNNYSAVYEKIKKLTAHQSKAPASTPTNGS